MPRIVVINPTQPLLINRKHYPQLDAILWDTRNSKITPQHAFQMYETRWRYIDKTALTPKEEQLIKQLTKSVGKGLFLSA